MNKKNNFLNKCLTQETLVIENPGPKLLAFIEKMRVYKNEKLKESKREFIRNEFINDYKMNKFYKYKDSIDNVTNLNDKYKLHLLTEKYPDDEVIDKLDNILSILDSNLDVIVIKNENREYQAFTVLNNGTNGYESCIHNSMKEIINKLDKLRENENVKWYTILDTHFDNMDDVYSWYLTFTLNEK